MKVNYFIPSQYEEFEKGIFKILRSGEPGSFLFPPNTNKSNRLITTLIATNKSEFHLIKIDLFIHDVEDIDDLFGLIGVAMKSSKRRKVGVLMANAQTLLIEKNYVFLNSIVSLQERFPQVGFVLLFNIDITHPDISKYIKPSIFNEILYYPLYSLDDTLGYINDLLKKWNFALTDEKRKKIAQNCGGYFWLVKQTVRTLRDNPSLTIEEAVHADGVRLAIEQFYTSLLESERGVLQNLILGKKIQDEKEKHSLEYLRKVKLIKDEQITISYLTTYIREYLPKMSAQLKDNMLHINYVNVDSHFSPKEKRAFKVLLNKKDQIVSRDEMAHAIWPIDTEEQYSDWAVDRIIARLREKIERLGFSKDVIKTLRKKGYMFVN